MTRATWLDALADSRVSAHFAAFDPHVAGTPPLGIDLPDSDIDILCHAPDGAAFCAAAWAWRDRPGFALFQQRDGDRATVLRFDFAGWPFEIYATPRPVEGQDGWRHFVVERRLLAIGGEPLRAAILAARRTGLKTEAAFARVLGLPGDPYAAMLALADLTSEVLATFVVRARRAA